MKNFVTLKEIAKDQTFQTYCVCQNTQITKYLFEALHVLLNGTILNGGLTFMSEGSAILD